MASSSSSSSSSPLSPSLSQRFRRSARGRKGEARNNNVATEKANMASRMYKTLPSALRRDDRAKHNSHHDPSLSAFEDNNVHHPQHHSQGGNNSSSSSEHGPLFSLNLNLSNLISGGMNFFGQLRKSGGGHQHQKSHSSASTPVVPASDSSSSLSSDLFYEAYEQIELSSFPSIPEAGDGHTGEGHQFGVVGSLNPTWCDLCGELIWGLYDTGASKCRHCQFTCHVKCQRRVRLNCSILASDEERLLKTSEEISETLKNSDGKKKERVRQETIEEDQEGEEEEDEDDPSTLANISTLRSEVHEEKSVSSSVNSSRRSSDHNLNYTSKTEENEIPASSSQQFLSALDDGGEDSDDDDDDDYKTLKDVDHFELEHDGAFGELSLVQTLQLPLRSEQLLGPDLDSIVDKYNQQSPAGQQTCLEGGGAGDDLCRGFIRVQLNLRRPINVISGTRPPSIYNITKDDTLNDRTLTSFYLPADTVKALHVTSLTTTSDVIKSLLAKFRVADNPHKYALYEKSHSTSSDSSCAAGTTDKSTLSRVRMRKMKDSERPLVLALVWCKEEQLSDKIFVLQENDPGEISWESFSVPELKNFLLILDREEAWYKKKIHEKYEIVHGVMVKLAEQKKRKEKEEEEAKTLEDKDSGLPSEERTSS